MQILLRLEIEAVCSDSSDRDEATIANDKTLDEVVIITTVAVLVVVNDCIVVDLSAPKWQHA